MDMQAEGEAKAGLSPLERWSQIEVAAQQALVTETMADAADGDAVLDLWLDYDEQCGRVLRLLTEDGAVPMRNAIRQALADVPEGVVPEAWTTLIARYREASDARAVMKNLKVPPYMRDQGARTYCAATDAMVAAMDLLSGDHTLGRITLQLSGGVVR